MSTTINDLNTTDELVDADKLVVWKTQAGATRAITAENAANYFGLSGGPYQPLDELLTAVAALGPVTTNGDFIQLTGQDTVRVRKLTVATYAALTAIAAAFRFDDMLVYVASRATDGDGGEGWWRFDAASSATANGGTILAPDSGTGRWIRQDVQIFRAEWFGAKGDASTDDTVAIQAALTALRLQGGGVLEFLADRTYMFSDPLLVGAKTWVRGGGWSTIVKATNTFQTGAWASYSDPTPGGFVNFNSQASSITDTDIWFSDFKIDMNLEQTFALYNETQACVLLRKTRGVRIHNMWLTDCSNGTATIGCEDVTKTNLLVTRISNAGIDAWEGSKRVKVRDCTVLAWCDANFAYATPPAGLGGVQGILFTGTGTFDDNNYVTEDVEAIGCTVKHLRATNASGIIANANAVNSTVRRARFIGNDIEDCYLPIVFSGPGRGHVAAFNTIHDSTGAGMYASQTDAGGAPSGVAIIGNTFRSVTLAGGVSGLIGSNGANGMFEGNTAESCTYDYAILLTGNTNHVGMNTMPAGSSGSVISDTGTGNVFGNVIQGLGLSAQLRFGGNSVGLTAGAAQLDYVKIGKRIDFTITIFLSAKGSSTGVASIALPYAALRRAAGSIGYFNNITGPPTLMNWIIDTNGTVLRLFKNTVTETTDADFANNSELIFSGSYITSAAG